MSSIYDGDAADIKKYVRLCQFYHMLLKSHSHVHEYELVTFMCKKGFDLNYSVPMNSFMCENQSELSGFTALHFAVMEQDIHMTMSLLEQGADFTMRNHYGHTALRMIVKIRYESFEKLYNMETSERCDVAELILKYHISTGNTTNPACNDGITHFYLACIVNNVSAIEFFLDNGASMTDVVSLPEFSGFTALHFAAMFCNYEAAEYLLIRGADAHIADANGWTPLHWLIKRRMEIKENHNKFVLALRENNDVIMLILERSINENIINPVDDIGLSHFHIACTLSDTSVIQKLLRHIEDVEAVVNLDSPVCPGYTPLHFAAAFNKDIGKLLVSRGANITSRDAKNVTPLEICFKHGDIHWMLSHHESLKEVSFSNSIKLSDFVLAVSKYSSLTTFLDLHLDVNDYILYDSPLWPGYTPLHLAVLFEDQGHFENKDGEYQQCDDLSNTPVRVCLKYNANCEAPDANGLTPLHLAFQLRNKKLVFVLLEHQSFKGERLLSINESSGVSNLHIACATRRLNDVKKILQHGADVNETTTADFVWYSSNEETTLVRTGSTPLHILLSLGGFDIVTTLLSLGADPMKYDARGLTCIHLAHVLEAPSFVVDQLLSNHNFKKINAVARGGLSHLHVACANGSPCTVESYLQLDGVDINANITNENDIDDRFGDEESDDNLKINAYHQYLSTHVGWSPMYFVVDREDTDPCVTKLLLQHGADLVARKASGKLSPLHRSIQRQDVIGIKHHITEKHGVVLGLFYERLKEQHGNGFVDDVGLTLLHVACQLRHVDEVKRLLEAGVDVNAQVHDDSPIWPGYTPLHMLVRWFEISEIEEQKKQIIRILLDYGADVDVKNFKGATPLHLAQLADTYRKYSGKDACVVDTLLSYSPTISLGNPTRLSGISHFHVACGWRDSARAIEEYLDRGGNRRIINRPVDHFANGYTPLHIAAWEGSVETMRVLLRHGADIWMEDCLGMTPLHIVVYCDHRTPQDEVSSERLEKISVLASFGGSEYLNARTVLGKTTLDLCLENGLTASAVTLLKLGASTVTRNPVTGKGTWALACEMNQFNILMENARDITKFDEIGANALQAIVQYHSAMLPLGSDAISKLIDVGCELDHQDQKGRTALHIATESYNHIGMLALLRNGADVNITDNEGCSAFDYKQSLITFRILTHYLASMRTIGLEVICLSERLKLIGNSEDLTELDTLQREFLTEQAIRDFPTMRYAHRETIRMAVERAESMPFTGLLKRQYRLALARLKVYWPAMQQLLRLFNLPELCCKIILRYLSTQDMCRLLEPSSTTNGAVAM